MPSTPNTASRPAGARVAAAIAAIVLAVLATYAQVGGHGFLRLDDDVYVTNNPQVLQGLTLVALGQLDALRGVSTSALLYVAASGLVGLTIGDTALFGAVARLGVPRTLLLQTLSPVFAASPMIPSPSGIEVRSGVWPSEASTSSWRVFSLTIRT